MRKLNAALSVLLEKDWIIDTVKFDRESFGDMFIEIIKEQRRIQFIQDRGQVWCNVICGDKKYFLEEIFKRLGCPLQAEQKELWTWMSECAQQIADKEEEILSI